jgi:hypothetical protein
VIGKLAGADKIRVGGVVILTLQRKPSFLTKAHDFSNSLAWSFLKRAIPLFHAALGMNENFLSVPLFPLLFENTLNRQDSSFPEKIWMETVR